MLKIADYCVEESRKQGTTDNQYKSALRLMERAMSDSCVADPVQVAVTQDDVYNVWWRAKHSKSSVRAIFEVTEKEIILHVVLPRSSATYSEVEELWKRKRQTKRAAFPNRYTDEYEVYS